MEDIHFTFTFTFIPIHTYCTVSYHVRYDNTYLGTYSSAPLRIAGLMCFPSSVNVSLFPSCATATRVCNDCIAACGRRVADRGGWLNGGFMYEYCMSLNRRVSGKCTSIVYYCVSFSCGLEGTSTRRDRQAPSRSRCCCVIANI